MVGIQNSGNIWYFLFVLDANCHLELIIEKCGFVNVDGLIFRWVSDTRTFFIFSL